MSPERDLVLVIRVTLLEKNVSKQRSLKGDDALSVVDAKASPENMNPYDVTQETELRSKETT